MIERLDQRAVEKVSGPAWAPLRTAFFDAARILLSVSPEATSELTTIYVKFCTESIRTDVYAVVWLRTAQMVVGLSLPDEVQSPFLSPPPQGMNYKGLTKYLTLRASNAIIPEPFAEWAKLAYSTVTSRTG